MLIGRSPVRAVRPSSTARGPSPGSKKPKSSVAMISAMVKQVVHFRHLDVLRG